MHPLYGGLAFPKGWILQLANLELSGEKLDPGCFPLPPLLPHSLRAPGEHLHPLSLDWQFACPLFYWVAALEVAGELPWECLSAPVRLAEAQHVAQLSACVSDRCLL